MNANKTSGKKLLKSRVHFAWLSCSFANFFEITGLFDTGSCQKFKQEILVEWNLLGGGKGGGVAGVFLGFGICDPLTTLLIFSEI